MIRGLVIASLFAAAPALAQTCDTVGDGVLFCPDDTPFAGNAGDFDPGMGVTFYQADTVMLLTGPLPPFAYDVWVATPGDLSGAAETFPAQESVGIMDRPSVLGGDILAETLTYMVQPDMISLVTVIDLSGIPHLVQTVEGGTQMTDKHMEYHRAALLALVEDDL
ncbi:hypothetical protein [Maritimibacter alexandrii]|uniref:hypothetical protein n=1 Tax=Maritimibacter alexandrii TaxID=2570355 RepID=UPI001107C387|nr:hypothetical protein [Maritimibacter alexandrii]